MKWRPVLIVLLSLFIVAIVFISFLLGSMTGAMAALNDPEAMKAQLSQTDTNIAPQVKYLQTMEVENRTYPVDVTSLGRVNASQAISVSAEVQGTLRGGSVKLKKGTSFRKGQVLFSVNNGDAALLLKARKSSYLNILASTLPDIKLDYPQHYEVWKMFFDAIDLDRGLPPLPPLVDNKLKTLLASRNILGEYYNIKADQVRLSKYTVYAPFNGTITDAFSDMGSIVNPGSPVVNIINNGELEVECPVSPEEIDLVRIGAEVLLQDENENTWKGQIIRKGMYLNPNTQSIPVFIQIQNQDDKLYNGMYLTAQIKGDSVSNVFEIPRRALLEKGNALFQLTDSSIVEQSVDIVVFKEQTVLVGGLKNGTFIVAEPVINPKADVKFAAQK